MIIILYDNQNNKNWSGEMAKNKLILLKQTKIPILVMEKIQEVPYKNIPDWGTYVDGGQVGINKKGKFKAFDYGIH